MVTGVAWESWQRWWTQAAPPALTSAATAVLKPWLTPWLTPWVTLWVTPWPTPWLTLRLVRDTARTSARRTGRWALSLQCATGCSRRDEHSRGGKNAATHMFVPTRTASAVAAEQGRGDRASPFLSSRASPVKSTAAQVSARWRTVNEPKPRSVEDLRRLAAGGKAERSFLFMKRVHSCTGCRESAVPVDVVGAPGAYLVAAFAAAPVRPNTSIG